MRLLSNIVDLDAVVAATSTSFGLDCICRNHELHLLKSYDAFSQLIQMSIKMEGHHMNYRQENPNHFCPSTPYVVFLFSFPKGILNFILLMSVVDCLIKRLNKCVTQARVLYNCGFCSNRILHYVPYVCMSWA